MRHLIVVLVLLIAASIAFAGTTGESEDTVTLRWKGVQKIGDQYCRWVGGGKFCIDAAEVVSVKEEGRYTIIVMKKEETELHSYAGKTWGTSSSGYRTVKT